MKNKAFSLRIGVLLLAGSLSPDLRADVQANEWVRKSHSHLKTPDPLPLKVQLALDHLKTSTRLESAHVGDAGTLSENLKQLREILAFGKSEPLLKRLYEEGSLAGKLYAIIGLQLLEDTELSLALIEDAYQFSEEDLTTLEGCILYKKKVGAILGDIERGYYKDDFASAK